MTFINTRLPTEVEIGAERIDDEDIEIVDTDGGFEFRNARAAQGLLRFELAYPTGTRDAANYLAVRAMFKAARKSLHTFRFRDMTEYTLTDEATVQLTSTTFQVSKSYTAGSETHVRKITRPVSPLTLKVSGVVVGSGYSIDYTTGIATFVSPPAATPTASGTFDIPVRFDGPLRIVGVTPSYDHIEGVSLKEDRE